MTLPEPAQNPNVNETVTFARGLVPDTLRRLEEFVGIPMSLRSISGEVVCKTDYFGGPCSIIRGTDQGRMRCRKTYASIETKLLRRKVPFVNICYAGFLIFAVPLELRGEMIGTMLGAQILPERMAEAGELDRAFGGLARSLGIQDNQAFYESFKRVRRMQPDFHRVSFLEFLGKLGANFSEMAFSDKPWPVFYREMRDDLNILKAR